MLEGSQEERSIDVCGRVVRVTNIGMGVEFYESDLDNYQRLRSLILLNSSDWLMQKQNSIGIQVSSHILVALLSVAKHRWRSPGCLTSSNGRSALKQAAISTSFSS
jgi:hypothetical protein